MQSSRAACVRTALHYVMSNAVAQRRDRSIIRIPSVVRLPNYDDTCFTESFINESRSPSVEPDCQRPLGREKPEVIPKIVIEKAPSAELVPNHFDQDMLPPFPIF